MQDQDRKTVDRIMVRRVVPIITQNTTVNVNVMIFAPYYILEIIERWKLRLFAYSKCSITFQILGRGISSSESSGTAVMFIFSLVGALIRVNSGFLSTSSVSVSLDWFYDPALVVPLDVPGFRFSNRSSCTLMKAVNAFLNRSLKPWSV